MTSLHFEPVEANPSSPNRPSPNHGRFRVTLPPDLLYFQGHFPDMPLLPGVAQLVALVLDRIHHVWPELGQPRTLTRLKFRRGLYPGDTIEVALDRSEGTVRFGLHRGEDLCTQGTLTFAV